MTVFLAILVLAFGAVAAKASSASEKIGYDVVSGMVQLKPAMGPSGVETNGGIGETRHFVITVYEENAVFPVEFTQGNLQIKSTSTDDKGVVMKKDGNLLRYTSHMYEVSPTSAGTYHIDFPYGVSTNFIVENYHVAKAINASSDKYIESVYKAFCAEEWAKLESVRHENAARIKAESDQRLHDQQIEDQVWRLQKQMQERIDSIPTPAHPPGYIGR